MHDCCPQRIYSLFREVDINHVVSLNCDECYDRGKHGAVGIDTRDEYT